eukprot:7281-Pelagococcus_subviridis.AAC.1
MATLHAATFHHRAPPPPSPSLASRRAATPTAATATATASPSRATAARVPVVTRRGAAVVANASEPSSSGRGGDLAPRDASDLLIDPFALLDQRAFPSSSLLGRDFERTFREVDDVSARLEERASRVATPGRTYRREERSERSLPGGGYSKTYYSESVTTFSGPVDVGSMLPFGGGAGLLFAVAAAAMAAKYARLARAFAAGFAATSYREDIGFFAKLRLVLFWPALWLTDARGFRSEFARALRAAEGGDASKTKNPPEPPPPRIEGGDETR